MKLAGIQSLRGVAANLVVIFHCLAIGLLPKYGFQPQFERLSFLRNFWSGVDLFFCISGFVMCYSYINSKVSGVEFFRARLVRIVPLYWICSTAVFSITVFQGSNGDLAWYLQSLLFFVDLETREPILAAGWTLQYEMFFYLIFAVVLLLFKRYRFLIISLCLVSIAIYQTNHFIILEFILGGIAYLFYKSHFFSRYSNAIFCIFFTVYVFSLFSYNQDTAINYRVIFFGIPALFIVASLANSKMPEKSLQTAGNYSYSLYLIHFPLLSFYFKIMNLLDLRFLPGWLLILLAVVFCNVAAFLTWKFI
jgi:exopolysaccharide production protein ExoZ